MRRLLLVLLLTCPIDDGRFPILVLPEDGCSQERDCECGVCPPYGDDEL